VKEFSKSVKIWQSYRHEFGDLELTFLEQSVVAIVVNWSQDWTKAACWVLDLGVYNVQWMNCDWSILLTTQKTGHRPNDNNNINNIWPLWLRKLPDISRSCVVTFLSVVASFVITYLRTYWWVPRWKGPCGLRGVMCPWLICWLSPVGPGHLSPSLTHSLPHFLIFYSIFTFHFFPFLLALSIFLLFRPFPSYQRLQVGGHRRRPNLGLVFLCYMYFLVKDACLFFLLYLI